MKFSIRQILASVGGAVIAAVIASAFGVKGTIVGVAIGSAAATIGTALVAQSIDRGHQAVKQVVVRAPDSSTSSLLRKLGATGSSSGAETVETATASASATPSHETGRLEISAVAGALGTERLQATTTPMQPALPAARAGARRFSWQAIAGTAAVVFVLALLLITAVELISGKPLAAIFGHAGGGTTVGNVVTPPPAATTSTTSTTTTTTTTTTSTPSTTSTTSSTSTTTSSSSSTTTTAPTGSSTTSTTPGASTTTTTGVGASTTTSTSPIRVGGGYQPLNSAGRRSTKLAMPSSESCVLATSSCAIASS